MLGVRLWGAARTARNYAKKNKAPRCWEREGDEDVVASRETKPGRRDKLQSMIAWSLYRVVHKKGSQGCRASITVDVIMAHGDDPVPRRRLQLSREKAGLAVPCSMFHVPCSKAREQGTQ
jgi:hypothetical protein